MERGEKQYWHQQSCLEGVSLTVTESNVAGVNQ